MKVSQSCNVVKQKTQGRRKKQIVKCVVLNTMQDHEQQWQSLLSLIPDLVGHAPQVVEVLEKMFPFRPHSQKFFDRLVKWLNKVARRYYRLLDYWEYIDQVLPYYYDVEAYRAAPNNFLEEHHYIHTATNDVEQPAVAFDDGAPPVTRCQQMRQLLKKKFTEYNKQTQKHSHRTMSHNAKNHQFQICRGLEPLIRGEKLLCQHVLQSIVKAYEYMEKLTQVVNDNMKRGRYYNGNQNYFESFSAKNKDGTHIDVIKYFLYNARHNIHKNTIWSSSS